MALPQNSFCEITIGDEMGNLHTYPAYTCGHCSNVVVMRNDRSRPRTWCHGCGHWICEKTDLCATHCTPLHAMAADQFINVGEHGKYVKAIMEGAESIADAQHKGLIVDV